MAAADLKRRVEKLEESIPEFPCPNRKHAVNRYFVLYYGEDPGPEAKELEELEQALEHCPKCKGKRIPILVLRPHKTPPSFVDPDVSERNWFDFAPPPGKSELEGRMNGNNHRAKAK